MRILRSNLECVIGRLTEATAHNKPVKAYFAWERMNSAPCSPASPSVRVYRNGRIAFQRGHRP
jgi:hypothetical protein